jgi:hypothetical protein
MASAFGRGGFSLVPDSTSIGSELTCNYGLEAIDGLLLQKLHSLQFEACVKCCDGEFVQVECQRIIQLSSRHSQFIAISEVVKAIG